MEPLVVGQIVEFLVWTELTSQSAGQLHVYLPLWDRGIDAVVHRRTDGVYIPVQVKGRTTIERGEAHFVIWAESLSDDKAFLICALLEGDRLGDAVLVVTERTFKQLAVLSHEHDRPIYALSTNFRPPPGSRWHPYVLPRKQLAARLGAVPQVIPALAHAPHRSPADRSLGALGEAEVLRRLAGEYTLNLFRPFPDLETAEIVVRHLESLAILGIQVKTVSVDAAHMETTVNIQRPSFRPSASTWLVVLAWQRDQERFHPECLVMPTMDVERIAYGDAEHLELSFQPGGGRHAAVEPYRRPLQELGREIAALLKTPHRGAAN